jgi:hypothetical protein
VLRESQIPCFVEVEAWHVERLADGTNSTWVGELSVLVRSTDGEFARYPILMCERTARVRSVAKALAEFFAVEHRILKLNWRARRRLKAAAVVGPTG